MDTLEILGRLMGSVNRVKVLRLFLLNPEDTFSAADIVRRSKVPAGGLRRELTSLNDAGFLNKTRSGQWNLERSFPFLQAVKGLVIGGQTFPHEEIIRRFKNVGRIKLLVVAGVFIQDEGSRADILIVADAPKKSAIDRVVRSLEAEVGKELRYSILDTEEFKYRIGVYDKFIRDILDYRHETVIDKLGV